MPFSLLPHASTTVLAVKGSLRRALRRALDGSGPFCKTFPSKREKGRSRTGTLQSNGLPLVGPHVCIKDGNTPSRLSRYGAGCQANFGMALSSAVKYFS